MKTLLSLALLFSACGFALAAEGENHTLVYKFTPGEEVRTRVLQESTVDTKIKGVVSIAKSRSVSTKVWKITAVDTQGNITLENSVADADMWQSVTGKPELKYNSRTDKSPPLGYQYVADSIGKPLATLTITPAGKLMERKGDEQQHNAGLGDLAQVLEGMDRADVRVCDLTGGALLFLIEGEASKPQPLGGLDRHPGQLSAA